MMKSKSHTIQVDGFYLLLLILILNPITCKGQTFHFSFLYSGTSSFDPERLATVKLAVDHVNTKNDLWWDEEISNQITFTYDVFESSCSQQTSADIAVNISQKKKSNFIIGDACSVASIGSATVFGVFKVPQISYLSVDAQLSDKSRFPYFSRVIEPTTQDGADLLNIVRSQNWTAVSIIVQNENLFISIQNAMQQHTLVTSNQIKIKSIVSFDSKSSLNTLLRGISQANSRVIIYLGDGNHISQVVTAALSANLINPHTQWICSPQGIDTDVKNASQIHPRMYTTQTTGQISPSLLRAYHGFWWPLGISSYGPVWERFKPLWEGLDPNVYPDRDGNRSTKATGMLYDAIIHAAFALTNLTKTQGILSPSGDQINAAIRSVRPYNGISGYIEMIESTGDRQSRPFKVHYVGDDGGLHEWLIVNNQGDYPVSSLPGSSGNGVLLDVVYAQGSSSLHDGQCADGCEENGKCDGDERKCVCATGWGGDICDVLTPHLLDLSASGGSNATRKNSFVGSLNCLKAEVFEYVHSTDTRKEIGFRVSIEAPTNFYGNESSVNATVHIGDLNSSKIGEDLFYLKSEDLNEVNEAYARLEKKEDYEGKRVFFQITTGSYRVCGGGYRLRVEAEYEDEKDYKVLILICTVIGFGFCLGLAFVIYWRYRVKKRKRNMLDDLSWVIDPSTLIYTDANCGSEIKSESNADLSFGGGVGGLGSSSGRHGMTVMHQSKKVFVSLVPATGEKIDLTLPIRKEMNLLNHFCQHENIVKFIGGVISGNLCGLVFEYMDKGSFEDLVDSNLMMDWDIRSALLYDIAMGMDYLHARSDLDFHGELSMKNCLINTRWIGKVSHFGGKHFRYDFIDLEVAKESENPQQLASVAPEILQKTSEDVGHPDKVHLWNIEGSKSGDVWSFGCVVFEMFTGFHIFDEKKKSAPKSDFIKEIAYGEVQPDLSLVEDNHKVKALVLNCLKQNPVLRNSFKQCLKDLKTISPGCSKLVDHMIVALEKYSSQLEEIVYQRTRELELEKKKSDQLLSEILPPKVCQSLRMGKVVEPEQFESVTIFFSDIVGFTSISSKCTPLQVVTLLNNLYTTFDSVISRHHVYKVETIGDAYMVVSGLPERIRRHACEIANMSLELLQSIGDFRIPVNNHHLANQPLQLRAGVHSGAVVAGVVGIKMPRYCLFGDTVNTASRMETASMALRVHLSGSTAILLQEDGGYELESRGEIEVKGKGAMETYWLNGSRYFSGRLPDRSQAVSMSQHEFK